MYVKIEILIYSILWANLAHMSYTEDIVKNLSINDRKILASSNKVYWMLIREIPIKSKVSFSKIRNRENISIFKNIDYQKTIPIDNLSHNYPSPIKCDGSFQGIPSTIENIRLDYICKDIYDIYIPHNVKEIYISDTFNLELNSNLFPESLLTLTFHHAYKLHIPLETIFTPNLRSLTLPIDCHINFNVLPSSLQVLSLYVKNELDLNNIPKQLKSLSVYINYDSIIIGNFPSTSLLTDLTVYGNYPIIPGSLPQSLETLKLINGWNQPLIFGVFPSKLKSLKFGSLFDQNIDNGVLPNSLQILSFGRNFSRILLPGSLPFKLRKLSLNSNYNKNIGINVLPKNLEEFNPGSQCQLSLGSLPNSLRKIKIPRTITSLLLSIGKLLPNSIEEVIFDDDWNWPLLNGMFPSNLKGCKFGISFNKEIPSHIFPESLVMLEFGNKFNKQLKIGWCPSTVKVIIFGEEFNQPLIGLPSHLESLKLGREFRGSLSELPLSLKSLDIYEVHH